MAIFLGWSATLPASAYSNGADIPLSSIITGWNVYVRQQPRGQAAPTDRNIGSGGWVLAASVTGNSAEVNFTCDPANNGYFALAPTLESGFVVPRVGHNSTRIECSPDLADPGTFKRIERPRAPRPSRDQR